MRYSTCALVMGAGPAGLSAGYVLTQEGVDVVVCDQEDTVGGLTRTIKKGGFRFDIGGHRFLTKNSEVHRFVENLMGDELIRVKRRSRILLDGRFVDYPLTLRNSLQHVGIQNVIAIPLDYTMVKIRELLFGKKVVSFEDWVVSEFGTRMFELFFKVYTEKIWGISCDRLSADWAAQRIRGISLRTALVKLLLGSNNEVPKSFVNEFYYFPKGYGRLSERLANHVLESNKIYLRSKVIEVRHDGRRIQTAALDCGGTICALDAEYFLSSIPITELVQIMVPSAPDDVIHAARSLRYRDLVTVSLLLGRRQVTPDNWVYIHNNNVAFARMHEPKNWSNEMAPPGKTSLVLEYFCDKDDGIWGMSDRSLVELTVHDLQERLRLIRKEDLIDSLVTRHPKAYPVYEVGYKTHLRKIYQYVAGFSNLQVIGRYGMFRYNNTDHSIETGIKAALNVLGGDYDLHEVNVQGDYLEEPAIYPDQA